jgi:hypothetical protein
MFYICTKVGCDPVGVVAMVATKFYRGLIPSARGGQVGINYCPLKEIAFSCDDRVARVGFSQSMYLPMNLPYSRCNAHPAEKMRQNDKEMRQLLSGSWQMPVSKYHCNANAHIVKAKGVE